MIEKKKKILIRLIIFLVFILIFSQFIQFSLTNPPHDDLINKFQNLDAPISLTKMIAKDLPNGKSIIVNSQEVSQLNDIFKKYSRNRDKRKTGEKILRLNNFIISSAISIGLSSTGPVGLVVGKMVHSGLNKMVDKIEDNIKTSSQVQLRHSLNEYRREKNDKYFENLKGKSYAEVFEEINGFKSPVYDKAINDLPEEARAIANSYFLQELNDALVNNQLETIANRAIIRNNQSEITRQSDLIKNHSIKIAVLSKSMAHIQTSISKGIGDIQKRQSSIITHIETLELSINRNTEDIGTIKQDVSNIQGILFDSLTPKQKLQAINTGKVPKGIISTSDQVVLEIHVEQQEAIEDFGSIAQGVGHAANILNNLSHIIELPDDLLNTANEMSQLGSVALEAVTSFVAGGPIGILGGISAISGLFGSGNNGIQKVLEGQQKILEGQQKILEGQQKIAEGIGHLAKGQRALLRNQKEIMKGVQDILNNQQKIYEAMNFKIDQYHEEVKENLNRLETRLGSLRDLITGIASKNIGHCEDLVSELKIIKKSMTSKQNLFFQPMLKYSDYQRVFNDSSIAFVYCIRGIYEILSDDVLSAQKSLNPFLLLKHLPYKAAFFPRNFKTYETTDFLNKIYSPVLSLLEDHINMLGNKKHLILKSLSTISFSYTELEKKLNGLFAPEIGRNEIFLHSDSQSSFNLLKDYISPHVLIRIAPYIMHFYPFLDIEKEGNLFPDYDTFIISRKTKRVSKNGLHLLKKLQKIVRLSIIQENIISGDLMLPIYHKILMNPHHPSQRRVKEIFKASGPQSILVKNFVKYVMHAALDNPENRSGNSREELKKLYRDAFNQGDNVTLIENVLNNHYYLFPKDLNVFWLKDRLAFNLLGVDFFLPEPEELEKLNLQHSDWYDIISDLDQYIYEGILDYSFGDHLSKEKKRLLNKAIAITEI